MSRILKSYHVNVGMPFQVQAPISFETIQKVDTQSSLEIEGKEASINAALVLEEANEQASFILKEAELEAEHILEDARLKTGQESIEICEQAQKQGYENGYNEAKKQYEDLLNEAESVLKSAQTEHRQLLDGMEEDIINLAIAIAKKVIGNEVLLNKENVIMLVKQALGKCPDREACVIRVSSEDYEFVDGSREKIMSMYTGLDCLEIKKDACLKPGSCIVDTHYGSVDASIDTQLEHIEQAFREALEMRG